MGLTVLGHLVPSLDRIAFGGGADALLGQAHHPLAVGLGFVEDGPRLAVQFFLGEGRPARSSGRAGTWYGRRGSGRLATRRGSGFGELVPRKLLLDLRDALPYAADVRPEHIHNSLRVFHASIVVGLEPDRHPESALEGQSSLQAGEDPINDAAFGGGVHL